eukprot:gene20428-26508_t
MPFKPDLRKKLQDLRSELDAGILPQLLYEEMCREAIKESGDDPFDHFSKHFGETVAILTPAQANLLNAIGDIDIDIIMPFIRRQRKRMLKENSTNNKQNVSCPECSKPFLSTQGLSTHLLAKHRKALDDYYMEATTGTLKLKPPDYVPPIKNKPANNSDNRFDSMANLASLASQRSAIETSKQGINGGDGLWLVKQVNDTDIDDNDSDSDLSDQSTTINRIEDTVSANQPTEVIEPSIPPTALDSLANIITTNEPIVQANNSSSDNSVGLDRRKFNHGLQQRKTYTKETKLTAISLRDQGKCSDEIAATMGIPKSNVEKWSSTQGREKIMRHVYNDMITNNTNPGKFYPTPLLPSTNLMDFNRNQYNNPNQRTNNMLPNNQYNNFIPSTSTPAWPTVTYTSGSLSSNLPQITYNNNPLSNNIGNDDLMNTYNDTVARNSTDLLSNSLHVIPPPAPTNKRIKTTSKDKSFANLPTSITTKRNNNNASNKRRPTASSSAIAAAVVAAKQNISFNNEGFSESDDDDNEVIGLLGDQMPISQRVTNTSI